MEQSPQSLTRVANTVSKNMGLSLARVAVNSLVALVLPAFLIHRLPVATYGAWVLILQLGAFVSYLDLGVQTGISKFVAEHHANGDTMTAGRYASAGLTLMSLTGLLGVALTCGLAWQVPRLFHSMPHDLYRDVRISVLLVGTSLSFSLVCSVFSAVFMGLQRFAIPMGIAILNRSTYTIAVLAVVFLHGSLASMGAAVAAISILTGLLQVYAWSRMAAHIRVSFSAVSRETLNEMISYCLVLGIWTIGMLCVNGLDVTIVGHYDFSQTGYYSTATLPISFIILIMSSMLGPLMPASSALSTHRTARDMGSVLGRITRYCTLLLLLTGLPLIAFGYPILRLWVGSTYAAESLVYLRILLLANVLRNLFAPFATMVVATGRLKEATAAPVLEAFVNLGASIYLARHYGAIGVALGTLLGALTSVSLHLIVSMHYTRQTLAIGRMRLILGSILRPGIVILPTLLVLFAAQPSTSSLAFGVELAVWFGSTLILAWFGALKHEERGLLLRTTRARLSRLHKRDLRPA